MLLDDRERGHPGIELAFSGFGVCEIPLLLLSHVIRVFFASVQHGLMCTFHEYCHILISL
jgi:hypothetical protein